MRSRLILIFLFQLIFAGLIPAQQNYYYSNSPRFLSDFGDTLQMALSGGFEKPQFSEIDLNGDGILDLFVFDRADESTGIYLNHGKEGSASYIFNPNYSSYFPKLSSFVKLIDYNNDGKPDIFTDASGEDWGVRFYKNTGSNSLPEFKLSVSQLWVDYPTYRDALYTASSDIPAMADIDGDGDLDILSFDVLGGNLNLYRNQAIEKAYPLDSLNFQLSDFCWGQFIESPAGDSFQLHMSTKNCGPQGRGFKKKHAGSSISLIDYGNDGDLDLFVGDIGFPNLGFLENGKTEFGHPVDSIVRSDPTFPSTDEPVQMSNMVGPFFIDADNDGLKDLITSPQDPDDWDNMKQISLHLNSNNANTEFKVKPDGFLTNQTLDFGELSAPLFIDLNDDSLQDLIVFHGKQRVNGIKEKRNGYEVFIASRNNDSNVVFSPAQGLLSLKLPNSSHLHPTATDLDQDGQMDIILGAENGRFYCYFNETGQNGSIEFSTPDSSVFEQEMSGFSSVSAGDITGDGNWEVLTSSGLGHLKLWHLVSVEPLKYEILQNDFGQLSNLNIVKPHLAKLDENPRPDLIMSSLNGLFVQWNLDTSITQKLNPDTLKVRNVIKLNREPFLGGELLSVSSSKIDSDQMPDLLFGNYRGGLLFLASADSTIDSIPVNQAEPTSATTVKIYPNPFKSHLFLYLTNTRHTDYILQLRSINGKLLETFTLKPGVQNVIELESLESGFYLVSVKNDHGFFYYTKVFKQ